MPRPSMSEATCARNARPATSTARLAQLGRLIGSAATAAAIVMLSSAGPAEAQAAPVTGVHGSPMVFTFVVDNAYDIAGLLFGDDVSEIVRVRIDWGDGTTPQDITSVGIVEHPYSTPGTYTVRVWPLFADVTGGSNSGPWLTIYGLTGVGGSRSWARLDNPPYARMTEVISFGDLGITRLDNAFNNHDHLTGVPATLPASVTSLRSTFTDSDAALNANISDWNVTNVTDMSRMFQDATSFDQPLNNWNITNVTDVSYMFDGATLFDQPLNSWNVTNVTAMTGMFRDATSFNQPLNNWNVTNVTDMEEMFGDATSFDQPLNNWNVTNVTNMIEMFNSATSFDQDLGDWPLNGGVNMFGLLDYSGLSVACYDKTLIGWAALGVSGRTLDADGLSYSPAGETARNTLRSRSWTISGDTAGGVAVGDCTPVAATSAAPAPGPTVSCSPSAPTAGVEVTCSVAGGDPSIEILWAVTSDGVTIASTGVTLGPDGAGTFRFTMPASAVGRPVLVELVGWTAPVAIGAVAGGPVPTRVPAGEGPRAFGARGGPATAAPLGIRGILEILGMLGMLGMLALAVAPAVTARAGASALHAGPRRARSRR